MKPAFAASSALHGQRSPSIWSIRLYRCQNLWIPYVLIPPWMFNLKFHLRNFDSWPYSNSKSFRTALDPKFMYSYAVWTFIVNRFHLSTFCCQFGSLYHPWPVCLLHFCSCICSRTLISRCCYRFYVLSIFVLLSCKSLAYRISGKVLWLHSVSCISWWSNILSSKSPSSRPRPSVPIIKSY